MPLRRSLPTLIVVAGTAWWASGLPLRPVEIRPLPSPWGLSDPIVLRKLQEGEEVTARYRSTGCYHSYTARVHLERSGDGGLEVVAVARSGFLQDLGVVRRTLSSLEIALLDGMLDLYRAAGWNGGCTTRTSIHLFLYRDGRLVGHERVEDSHCLTLSGAVSFSFDHLVAEALDRSVW